MTDFHASRDSAPIESVEQLVEQFHVAGKPRSQWRIGTEYEKVAVQAATGKAARFSGPQGIETFLRRMAERFGWEPNEEDGRVVSLARAAASITLEPGGQVELSGAPLENLHQAEAELQNHIDEILAVGGELGIRFLGLGVQPCSRLDEIEWVPKQRYRIMGPYMERVGTLGQRMMKQTATVQTNIDFADERDAMRKMHAAMALSPIINALFANSPVVDGRASGFLSFRGHVWSDTDAARCGILPFVFREGAGFHDYVNWALDVPLYFVLRDGVYVSEVTGLPFRRFLQGGAPGFRATMDDWHLHLTTLFPEVRLKKYIEIRSADSQMPDRLLALSALTKGLFYEEDCLDAALGLAKRWDAEGVVALYAAVVRESLDARSQGIRVVEFARELYEIAVEGLRRQGTRDEQGRDERRFLEPLGETVASGKAPAQRLASAWMGAWAGKVGHLIDATAYQR